MCLVGQAVGKRGTYRQTDRQTDRQIDRQTEKYVANILGRALPPMKLGLQLLESLIKITKRGGIVTTVKGRAVIGKVWIHFIIGDIQGNNRWVGHFNGTGELQRPYRDCMCCYGNMNNPNPHCQYITPTDVQEARDACTCASSKAVKDCAMQLISKLNIGNAFMSSGIPLSDRKHGIYRIVPPERFHTTNEGVT